VNHSPSGFEWGHSDSGSAQLAFAILHHHFDGDSDKAFHYYQPFKATCLAIIDGNKWVITTNDIDIF